MGACGDGNKSVSGKCMFAAFIANLKAVALRVSVYQVLGEMKRVRLLITPLFNHAITFCCLCISLHSKEVADIACTVFGVVLDVL